MIGNDCKSLDEPTQLRKPSQRRRRYDRRRDQKVANATGSKCLCFAQLRAALTHGARGDL